MHLNLKEFLCLDSMLFFICVVFYIVFIVPLQKWRALLLYAFHRKVKRRFAIRDYLNSLTLLKATLSDKY